MKFLVVGSGGREHALAWKLAQEAEVWVAPGNPGIREDARTLDCQPSDREGILKHCRDLDIDCVLIGPENPLIDGLADFLRENGLAVFGPNQDAARLEGSKAFSKQVMKEAGIPTAQFESFTQAAEAKSFAREFFAKGKGVAVKASGPALGKGVVVCDTYEQAEVAIDQMMTDRLFGDSGLEVVIEEKLTGKEFSLLTLCSGTDFLSLPVAQDYKRVFDADEGPNTGGMGSYSPVAWVTREMIRYCEDSIVSPLLRYLSAHGMDYRGVLFSGLMMDGDLPKCLEFNVRFGDPETQSVMMRLGAGFAGAIFAVAQGRPIPSIEVLENAAVSVVLASGGYPENPDTGHVISLPSIQHPEVKIFHAGTKEKDGSLINSGGRVLAVSSACKELSEARDLCYSYATQIRFEGMQYRKDIGR